MNTAAGHTVQAHTAQAHTAQAHTAEDRLTRAATRFVAAGLFFYLAIVSREIIGQAYLVAGWWTRFAVSAFVAAGVYVAVASWRSMSTIAVATRILALAYLVVAISWLLSWNGAQIGTHASIWFTNFGGLAAMAVAIRSQPRWAFTLLAAIATLIALTNDQARLAHGHNSLVLEVMFSFGFCSLFTAGCIGMLRTGRMLDRTSAQAQAQASATATALARESERRRIDGLIHDGVIATLLSASRATNTASLARQAQNTLDQLAELRIADTRTDEVPIGEALALLRSTVTGIDDAIDVRVEGPANDVPSLPADVVDALNSGAAESVRNVVRHAGAEPFVRCELAVNEIRIEVSDDGRGFDPAAVPTHRLGIRVSIRDRLAQIPGGWAVVDSTPGAGTRIRIGWSRTT